MPDRDDDGAQPYDAPPYGPPVDGRADAGSDDDSEQPYDGAPAGESYDWYVRGLDLLDSGNAAAAVQVLSHASAAEPQSRAAREALARAQFDAGLYVEARESFEWIIGADPTDDYAQFGLGLAAARTGDFRTAVEHLSLAAAMRPDVTHYTMALRGARAALRP